MRSVTSEVHAFRRRWIPLLLGLAAIAPTPALAQAGDAPGRSPTIDAAAGAPIEVTWTKADVAALLAAVEAADEEELDPDSYDIGMLRQAVLRDVPPPNALMTELALKVAHDFRYGHVGPGQRIDWRSEAPGRELLRRIVAEAVAEHRLAEALTGLLPSHPRYLALKRALADSPASDTVRRDAGVLRGPGGARAKAPIELAATDR